MTRIATVSAETARGLRRLFIWRTTRQYGYLPGVMRVLLTDLAVARPVYALYRYLNLRRFSPLSRLQREMVAVVVNGHVGGAP